MATLLTLGLAACVPLPTGATLEEVDLSRFGRGTYMTRFTSPDGVQHERVVLE
jgi:hypothetical protein